MRDIVRENPSLRIRLVVNKSYSAVVAPTVINDTDMAPAHRQWGGSHTSQTCWQAPLGKL